MSTRTRLLVIVSIALATIGCDQGTKRLAVVHLEGLPRLSFAGDTIRLEYVRNPGAFLGLGAALPPEVRRALFTFGVGVLLAGLSVVLLRERWRPLPLAGMTLLWAGGVSNLIDRALHGSVVDFLNVGIGGLRTGIFNLADSAILLGMALVLLSHWKSAETSPDNS
jgi:signal peptidase II